MFNSTHTLVGFALSRAGLDRLAPYASWTAVIASNLPDIDIVTQLGGTASYIDHHRGITHSVLGMPFLALAFAFVMHRISLNRGNTEPFWKHFAIALIAMATHPLLDWTNSYGVQPYLPFDRSWYFGDTLFVIDPYLDIILLAGVLLSRTRKPLAYATLAAAILYIGARVESREIATRELAGYSRTVPGFRSSAVEPTMLNPFVWTGFVESDTDVARIFIDLPTGVTERVSRLIKALPSPAIQAAEATYTAKVFQGFARFPVTQVEETSSGYRIMFVDVRFYRAGNTAASALAAEILLDRSLRVQSEDMSFTKSLPLKSTD